MKSRGLPRTLARGTWCSIGAVAKGRSSSYKVNGLLRAQLPFLVLGNIALALLWIETESNLADHPSRFRELPPPKSPQAWMARYGVRLRENLIGVEVFTVGGEITAAHRAEGLEMSDPCDGRADASFVVVGWLHEMIRGGRLGWIWLAPPRLGSRSSDRTWTRALGLAALMYQAGGFFIIEHPCKSRAWSLRVTELFEGREVACKHHIAWGAPS